MRGEPLRTGWLSGRILATTALVAELAAGGACGKTTPTLQDTAGGDFPGRYFPAYGAADTTVPASEQDATVSAPDGEWAGANESSSGDAQNESQNGAPDDSPDASLDAAPEASIEGGTEASACDPAAWPHPGAGTSVLQFHKNASHDGVYIDPSFTRGSVGSIRARITVPLDGRVLAQPLYVARGPLGEEAFVAVTETNHVTVVDGCGQRIWDKTYGAPVATGDFQCGAYAIPPALGITGTPVIDEGMRVIYFDAMTQTGSGAAGMRHFIHAVSLDDGTEQSGWPVDVSAAVPGFDSSHQNQRGALQLLGGMIYVPYGGLNGDCPQYYGWIVGVSVSSPKSVGSWRTVGGYPWDAGPPFGSGGLWAVGGLASDGTSLFAASGNTMNLADGGFFHAPPSWLGGNAIFRLGPGPSFSNSSADYFYPSNWSDLDKGDLDLGSSGPVLFDIGSSHYVLGAGKDGNVYILNRDNLGGQGGAVSVNPRFWKIVGAPAVYTTASGTYVALPNSGSFPIRPQGNPPVPTLGPPLGPPVNGGYTVSSPMVTTTDGSSNFIVWSASSGLYAYDGETGESLVDGGQKTLPSLMNYFNSPIAANGRIVVATCGFCSAGESLGASDFSGLVFFY